MVGSANYWYATTFSKTPGFDYNPVSMSTLIQLNQIHKSHGDRVLFDGASAQFASRDKIGVIGRNGAGKTTLCRILLGEEEIDDGGIMRSPQLRLSHVEQRSPFEEGETVIDFLTRYTEKEDWRCAKIAGRFQLRGPTLDQAVSDLSGGFQTRVKLAAMMLTEPNFLILDEPTNYLDLRTLLLLERFLKDYRGGYLVVSHDREFLKRTCDKTLEIERGEELASALERVERAVYAAKEAGRNRVVARTVG